MSTKNAQKVTAQPGPALIPDADAPALPDVEDLEGLVLGPPFAMSSDCELVERGQELCPECGQPEVSGATAIVKCECGQLFRVDLLTEGAKPCPARCGRLFTHLLLVTPQDDDQVFADASVQVLRANGYTVQQQGDDDADPEGDPEELDDDEQPDDDDEDTDPAAEPST